MHDTTRSSGSARTAAASIGSDTLSIHDVDRSIASVSRCLHQLNRSGFQTSEAVPLQAVHETAKGCSNIGVAAGAIQSNAVPIDDMDRPIGVVNRFHPSVSRCRLQLNHAESQTLQPSEALEALPPQETRCGGELHGPNNEKGCSSKAVRVPFSDWVHNVAASLKHEMLPCFEELGSKLDSHMEKVNRLLLQQPAEREGCSKGVQPAKNICRQDTNGSTFSTLVTWEEPDQPVRPQSPRAMKIGACSYDDQDSPHQQQVHTKESKESKELLAATKSEDVHGSLSPPAHGRRMFRKTAEHKWISTLISRASQNFDEMQSLTLRQSFAQRLGISKSQISGDHGGYLMQIVKSRWFTSFWTFMIVVDGLNNAASAHVSMVSALKSPPGPGPGSEFEILELTLATLFLLELVLRIAAWKWAFFLGKDCIQNAMEAAIIVFTFIMDLSEMKKNEYARVARSFRFIRVLRSIMRSKRLLSLRFMLSSMLNCGPTLMWAIVVIAVVLYFFSVVLLQVASNWLREFADMVEHQSVIDALRSNYNGFQPTMISLFMAVTGGTDWRDLYLPLAEVSTAVAVGFLCYICLMVLGVFNVLVGICADRAFAASRSHRDFVEHEDEMHMISLMRDVREMFAAVGREIPEFAAVDQEHPESITREQFLRCQHDKRIVSFLKSHQMHMIEPSWLFNMLDKDGSGSLTLSELTVGLLRLSGQARSSDVLLLVMLTMEVRDEIAKLKHRTERKHAALNVENRTQRITQHVAEVEELQ